jgi:3-deoxy-manno-octulosonate cytidylyltransferase (CMP-KDO synthetase)
MVQWTYENAARCKLLTELILATDSEDIAASIRSIGGKVIMTPADLPTGSDRVAFVAEQFPKADVVVNLQGDEPFIRPEMLEQLLSPYVRGENPDMATLAYPLSEEAYSDPGAVKVITDLKGDAIYFSRAPIPYFRQALQAPVFHHMGLYAFRRDFLLKYRELPQTMLEKVESLEQLRAIEHGYRIRVSLTQHKTLEINTPEEYEKAQAFALNYPRD